MVSSILYFNGLLIWCMTVPEDVLANNADPDEMPPYVAFHLSLYTHVPVMKWIRDISHQCAWCKSRMLTDIDSCKSIVPLSSAAGLS